MQHLKETFLLALLLVSTIYGISQAQTQHITVVHYANGSCLFETSTSDSEFDFSVQPKIIQLNQGSYWITPQTNSNLLAALQKAISWAKLNETHQKSFEKELLRIRVTDKETFQFYKRYISEFSKEAILLFTGFEDGTFKCELTIKDDDINLLFVTSNQVSDFRKLLLGKSVNKEIDSIFH